MHFILFNWCIQMHFRYLLIEKQLLVEVFESKVLIDFLGGMSEIWWGGWRWIWAYLFYKSRWGGISSNDVQSFAMKSRATCEDESSAQVKASHSEKHQQAYKKCAHVTNLYYPRLPGVILLIYFCVRSWRAKAKENFEVVIHKIDRPSMLKKKIRS